MASRRLDDGRHVLEVTADVDAVIDQHRQRPVVDRVHHGVRGDHDPVRAGDAYGFDVRLRYTGSGVYILHVDENVIRETLRQGYLPNDFVDRKGVDLEEADGVQDLDGPGPVGFALGSHWDSYRSGDNNQNAFGPGTKPSSHSNSGVGTGIYVENISVPGLRMRVTVRRQTAHTETRRRWSADAWGQPASAVDLDGIVGLEIVLLADTGEVYVFNSAGAEYIDFDNDPRTIEPYISAPGALWTGPPAFADLDGGSDTEIIAGARNGNLYAWKSNGLEMIDGDGVPATLGILHAGAPLAAPPMLVDVAGTSTPEVVIVERMGDSLRVQFVDAWGAVVVPRDPAIAPLWPVLVPGQFAAPVSLARTAGGVFPGLVGVVVVSLDTLSARVHVSFVPIAPNGAPLTVTPSTGSYSTNAAAGSSGENFSSPPAVGDIDGDGHDEIVMTMPDGRILIFESEAIAAGNASPLVVNTRAGDPSAPALGDVDGDGTLEIALWDREFMYALKSNGRDMVNWPRPILEPPAGDQPPMSVRRRYESPVIGDISGDGRVDMVYLVDDGSLHAFHADGSAVAGFPRTGTAAPATPSIAALSGAGKLSLVMAGTISRLGGADTVVDTFATTEETTLSIQSLSSNPVQSAPGTFVEETFMIYPNPVPGSTVHARIMLNTSATVNVHIYNLEGEETFSQSYAANSGGAINTPFDEVIDVSNLKSGVYFLRLRIEGAGGSESLVKAFAIRR